MVLPYDNMAYGVDEIGARKVSELNDIALNNLANNEILQYNSSNEKWENVAVSSGATTIDNLTDTNITSLQNQQYLRYNSTTSKWENFTLTITDNNTDNLNDLTDTNLSSVGNGEILKYNSTNSKWENNNLSINEIQDVNITSLANGEILKYNSTSGKWENVNRIDTLNEITDVAISNVANNQILKYNSTSSNFVNAFVNLTELADTNISSLNNKDILLYNSTSSKWETNTFTINDLTDVNITSLANNEILKYNSTTSKWENSDRIDSLNELGDVVISNVASNDLLKYNGSNFVNTKIAFDNNFTNVNFGTLNNGDLIKYNGSNFVNFAPTFLSGSGITDGKILKVVSGASVESTITDSSVQDTSTLLLIKIPGSLVATQAGAIQTEIFDTNKTRMHLTTSGVSEADGITITSQGKVGIATVEPAEALDITGNTKLNNTGKLIFYDTVNSRERATIDSVADSAGGAIVFSTKVSGGNTTEKIRINNKGAIGLEGANYGSSGQILSSNGSNDGVSWINHLPDQTVSLTGTGATTTSGTYPNFTINSTDTNTVYSAGAGISINGSNEISNSSPDQTVSLTGTGATTTSGTYPNFTINSTDTNTTYSAGSQIVINSSNEISLASAISVNYLVINNTASPSSSNIYTLVNETIASNNGATADSFGIKYNSTYVFKIGNTGTVHLASVLFVPYNVAVSAQNLSDDRYKSRERPLPNDSLSIIQQLKPSRYLLHPDHEVPIDDEDSDLSGITTYEQAGLIAQELEQIEELAFVVKEFDGIKTVDYNSIFPYVIKALQELTERVKALESR